MATHCTAPGVSHNDHEDCNPHHRGGYIVATGTKDAVHTVPEFAVIVLRNVGGVDEVACCCVVVGFNSSLCSEQSHTNRRNVTNSTL